MSAEFPDAVLIEEHSTLLNYEVPRHAIPRLSQTFRLLESNKSRLALDDYVLSQSTLEQVFFKQIRPTAHDAINQLDQESINARVPLPRDYITAYFIWMLAFFIPGLHHFYLGNFWRGMKYLFTLNEVCAGWVLDLFELHVLVQKSVQEKGHIEACCWCQCCSVFWYVLCFCGCCGLCKKSTKNPSSVDNNDNTNDENTNTNDNEERQHSVNVV